MAKKAKGNRVQVILECTEMKESGLPGTTGRTLRSVWNSKSTIQF